MVIRIDNYPDRLGPSGKFFENPTKLICLETTGYRIKYSTVVWHLELRIRRGRKVQTQVHTVNTRSNSRTSNCQCSLLSKNNPIIRIFYISRWLAVPINPNKWGSTEPQTARNTVAHFLPRTRNDRRVSHWITSEIYRLQILASSPHNVPPYLDIPDKDLKPFFSVHYTTQTHTFLNCKG
jgi:hypothetical protein